MKMKKIWKIRLVLLFVSSFIGLSASAQLERYYAAYIYQFSRYINWPSVNGDFVIAIVGNSPVYDPLQQLVKDKKVGAENIVVVRCTPENICSCNILFIPESQKRNFQTIKNQVENKNILLVTESSGMISRGAGISFSIDENKIKFDLNTTLITKSGMNVSKNLEKLALNVY
jgi:hypothetical protein